MSKGDWKAFFESCGVIPSKSNIHARQMCFLQLTITNLVAAIRSQVVDAPKLLASLGVDDAYDQLKIIAGLTQWEKENAQATQLTERETIDEKKDRDFWKKKAEKLEQKYVQNNEEWQKWALVLVERIKALVADLEKAQVFFQNWVKLLNDGHSD